MSQVLESGATPNSAPPTSDAPPPEAPDSAAPAADSSDATAALSGQDAIARLDSEFKQSFKQERENLLKQPEETEQQTEPETEVEQPEAQAAPTPEPAEPDEFTERTGPRTREEIDKLYSRAPIPVREDLA